MLLAGKAPVAQPFFAYADEAKSYDSLHAVDMKRIDHSKIRAENEVLTIQAESFFSGYVERRWEPPHIAGRYFDSYAGENS